MTKSGKTRLPHGTIPFSMIRDVTVRDAVMKLNENICSLERKLSAAIAEIEKLRRR